jgi:hypothetical protein
MIMLGQWMHPAGRMVMLVNGTNRASDDDTARRT